MFDNSGELESNSQWISWWIGAIFALGIIVLIPIAYLVIKRKKM